MKKILFGIMMLLPMTGMAKNDVFVGPYQASVIRVLDGDTIEVRAKVWPDVETHVKVRVNGINAPEIHTRRTCEKQAGLKAKKLAERTVGTTVTLKNVQRGKYAGRVVADVITTKGSLKDIMLKNHLAMPYSGGKRKPWPCF